MFTSLRPMLAETVRPQDGEPTRRPSTAVLRRTARRGPEARELRELIAEGMREYATATA